MMNHFRRKLLTNKSTMHINDLPPEMLVRIFSYLPVDSLLDTLLVCKRWQVINHSLYSWKIHPIVYDSKRTKFKEFIELVKEHHNKIGNIIFRGVDYEEIHQVINVITSLTRFEMIMCSVNVQLPTDLLKYPCIKYLHIRNCYVFGSRTNMEPYDLNFDKLQKLESLLLPDFGLSNHNFEGLLSCTKLSDIFIEKIRNISQDYMIRLLIERKNKLHGFGMYAYGYTDEVTKHISACSNLTRLRIIRCDKLTNKSLTFLQCLNLTELILWNNAIFTLEGLISLFQRGNLKNLKVLSLSKISNLNMELLQIIAENCVSLVSVGIYRCPLMQASIQSPIVVSLFSSAKVFFE